MTTPTIRNVAWYGTGNTGLPVLEAVLASGKFDVKLLLRNKTADRTRSLPSNITTVTIDFDQPSTLVEALRGQDAVVVFTKFAPGSELDRIQIALIDAAIKAGVKLFVPSEWAPDTAGGNAATSRRIGPNTLPPTGVIGPKRAVHNYLFTRGAEGTISYAMVFAGVILASSLKTGALRFNFKGREADLPDGGIHPFSTTSLKTLCSAVIGVLSEYPKTRNRLLYVADGVTTQRDLLAVVEGAQQQRWTRRSFPIIENKERAEERIRAGTYGFEEFVSVLMLPFFGGMTVWATPDNELLGIKEEDLVDPRDEMARLVKIHSNL
ncbi:isoflavone reductase family protein [Xylogone sp. PMI_703]|nr:isoflavone reductase family protein [Xylogone sp. PMI_703]